MRAFVVFLIPAALAFFLARLTFSPSKDLDPQSARGYASVSSPLPEPVDELRTAPDSKDRPPRERLKEAFRKDDPLESARRVLAWLESATAEEFRELAKEMSKFPAPNYWNSDQIFRDAYADAVVARWAELDAEGLIETAKNHRELGMKKKGEPGYHDCEWLLPAIGRTRPELALEKLPLSAGDGYPRLHVQLAFRVLAARDERAARRHLERLQSPSERKRGLLCIVQGVAEVDPVAAVRQAAELNEESLYRTAIEAAERIGPGAVREVIATAPDKYTNYNLPIAPPELSDLLASFKPTHGGQQLFGDLASVADRTTREDREKFFANYDSVPKNLREPLAAALANSWARTEPAAAAAWALAHAEPENHESTANGVTRDVFLRWFNTDASAAISWWNNLPASPLRDALGNEACTKFADEGKIEEALAMYRPLAGKSQPQITQMLAQNYAEREPAAAASWLMSLPPDVAISDATTSILSRWIPRDPEGVANWIQALPPSGRRDEIVSEFIESAGKTSTSGAEAWVEEIVDPVLRMKAAESAFWRIEDRAAAREWIRNLKGVDPVRHGRFLRTLL
jgi:hypothetical protein